MSRRRRSIWEIIERMFREIEEEMYSALERAEESLWHPEEGRLTPLTELTETPDEVIVTADLPYVSSVRDIEVSAENHVLRIRARLSKTVRHDQWVYGGYNYTEWFKEIVLPSDADTGKMKIRFKSGVLEIRIPKKRGRVIPIS